MRLDWQPEPVPPKPVKFVITVSTPAVVILKIVPLKDVPPALVVPYRFPSLACSSAAFGPVPVVLVQWTSVLNAPPAVNLKTVPRLPFPPALVVP